MDPLRLNSASRCVLFVSNWPVAVDAVWNFGVVQLLSTFIFCLYLRGWFCSDPPTQIVVQFCSTSCCHFLLSFPERIQHFVYVQHFERPRLCLTSAHFWLFTFKEHCVGADWSGSLVLVAIMFALVFASVTTHPWLACYLSGLPALAWRSSEIVCESLRVNFPSRFG